MKPQTIERIMLIISLLIVVAALNVFLDRPGWGLRKHEAPARDR